MELDILEGFSENSALCLHQSGCPFAVLHHPDSREITPEVR